MNLPPAFNQNNNLQQGSQALRVNMPQVDLENQREAPNLLSHINIYLTPSFIDGKPTKGKPLRVFRGETEPQLKTRQEIITDKKTGATEVKQIQYYEEFDEKKGYRQIVQKIDEEYGQKYNAVNMRNFQRGDGMAYLYSRNKRLDIDIDGKKQKIEAIQMLICVTMYGEDKDFLINTLRGIHSNLKGFRRMGISPKQIVVVIFQDGIMKMKEEMVDYYSELDIKQNRELALVRRRQVIKQQERYLKQNKQQSVLDYNDGLPNTIPKKIALLYQDMIPFEGSQDLLTTFSVFKHLNAKKLSSHLWFFEGFCRQFEPKYCALVDVGTIPDKEGLVNMFKALEGNMRIGGVCGFMGLKSPKINKSDGNIRDQVKEKKRITIMNAKQGHEVIKEEEVVQNQQNNQQQNEEETTGILKKIQEWFLSLPLAQNYEYTTAHMIDKNFESALGFLHVLPGAWSAYRYKALNLTKENRENLIQKRYLKQILNKNLLSNTIQELNMFLAEDRILCLGIFCQIKSDYLLKYIPNAIAFTDPIDTFEDFLQQRRRWINSSWFALNYVLQNFEFHIKDSSHSLIMKEFILPINMFCAQVGKFNTYFIPAFYLFVSIICSFQFLKPSTQHAYKLISTPSQFQSNQDLKCNKLDEEPKNICAGSFTESCYITCENYKVPNVFFAFLNLIPAIFVVIILMIILASLIFKPKNVKITSEEESEYLELQRRSKQKENLTSDEKKRRMLLQNKLSQRFQNNVFKTLAILISLISCCVFVIVLLTIILNLLNDDYGMNIGFQKLTTNFRIYLIVMVALNYGSFFLSMACHIIQPFIVWNVIKSFFSYWVYSPIYNHILLIFSFCNIDDVTWGTKGLTDSKHNDQQEKQKNEKIDFVGTWLLWNTFLLTVLLTANSLSTNTPYVIMALGGFGTAYSCFKTFIGIFHYLTYYISYIFGKCCQNRKKILLYSRVYEVIENIFQEKQQVQIQKSIAMIQDESFEESDKDDRDLNDSFELLHQINTEIQQSQGNMLREQIQNRVQQSEAINTNEIDLGIEINNNNNNILLRQNNNNGNLNNQNQQINLNNFKNENNMNIIQTNQSNNNDNPNEIRQLNLNIVSHKKNEKAYQKEKKQNKVGFKNVSIQEENEGEDIGEDTNRPKQVYHQDTRGSRIELTNINIANFNNIQQEPVALNKIEISPINKKKKE